MTTYAQRIIRLNKEYTANDFFTTAEDMEKVEEALGLKPMTELELRNIRDMYVLITSNGIDRADERKESRRLMNNLQSVTAVIDNMMWMKGYEV